MSKACIFLFIMMVSCIDLYAQNHKPSDQTKEKDMVSSPEEEVKKLTDLQQKFYNLGNFELFKEYTDSILYIARANDLKEFEIDAVIRQGVYFNQVAKFDKALTSYLEAMDLAKTLPKSYQKETVILINMGNVYNTIKYTGKAKVAFNKALGYIDTYGGPDIYKMAIHMGLGVSSHANKEFEESLEHTKKAKEIGIKLKRTDIIIAALNNMADVYNQLNKPEKALECTEEALHLYEPGQSEERRALSLFTMGCTLINLKRYKDAIKPLDLALTMAISNKYPKIEKDAHKQLSRVYEELEDFQKANQHQKAYTLARETYLNTISDAKKLEVEKDLSKKEDLLKEQNVFIVFGLVILFLIVGILFFSIWKKKKIDQERKKIKEDYSILSGEHLGLKSKMQELAKKIQKQQEDETTKTQPQYKNSSLTDQDRDRYMNQILDYMEKEKPYLDFEINQTDLAAKLNISSHHFSEVLSFCFEQNFYNFINIYRVNEAKKIMKDPQYDRYKILAIGYEAGFKSKTSFNRVFKTHVGLTPSEYKKKQISLN